MDTWTFIIDGVEWNTPGNTEEEAFQSTYKAIEASQTLDNVHANAQSLNDTKDPAYAKRFMDTVRGADKYEQLTGSKDGWSAVGMKKGSADWSKRVGQLDQELISSGNQTISGFISAEKQKDFNAKVDVLKKKHPGSQITQDKDGNPIVAPASQPTKLSPTLQRWQKEKQSWKAIKKEDIKFSGPALAWITQFVENRHITSLAPNAAVSKMATELLEIHPGWNQDELVKALRYSLAKPVRTEGPNYNTAEAQHAQKMNRQDLAADGGSAVSMEEFQRGAQAAQSGAIGGVLGAASNITFGLGEKEIRAWLDKHGYKVDEASYAASKVGALPAALAAGGVEMLAGKAVKAIANTEKVAGMIARGKTALSTGKIAKGYEEFAAVGRLVDGPGLLKKTGASLYRAGQSVKSGIQALRPASEAVDEIAKAKNIRQIYNGVRAINSYAMPMTRTASAFIDLKKQAFEGYQSKENPLDRNFLDNWYASEATGYLTGETAALSRAIVEHANDKDPAIRHKLQAELEAVQREAQGVIQDKRFVDTVNKGEWMQAGVMLPVYIGQLIAQSMNSQYEQIKRQIGATAVASGLGAWPARIMGGMFSGAGSVSVNYASKLSEIFQKDGIDLTDDNAVIEAMKDPVAMAKRKRDALAYGIGTGFTDGFMALLGGMAMGRLASGSKAKAIANINYVEPRSLVKFGAGIADWTGQMFGGGMSEVIGQKLQAGDIKAPVSMPDVWAEVLGEGKEPVNIAMGVYADASDPIYAINTSLRNATPEIKFETYKATAQATAANPNSSELAQRHQAVKNMMREEAKANPEITTTDNVGNAINVKIDDASLDAIEAEAKRQFDPNNMSVEDKKKFLTTVDVQLAMGAANVDTNLMSYYSRLMHGLTETERSEIGMTLNEDGTSDYQTHVQGIANDYIARRDTTANMEMRINRMSSILADDGTVTSTGVDTFDKDTSAEVLMVEAENIHQLREQALSSNSTKLFQQYDDDMSKINLALMARFQTEPTYTTAIDTYVDNAIPAFIQDQTDKAGSLNGTMTVSGKEVDGVFSINDDHAFFTPDGQDVTVPIDYKNLDDFKFKAGVPVEEVVQPSAEPAQPEQPYVPVAERFVAEPKTPVESTVYTKYDDLQKQLSDMEIHTPQEPKTPNRKALQSEVRRYRRLKQAYDTWISKHDALVAGVDTAKQLSELTRQLEELDNAKPETPSKSKGDTVYQRQLKEYNAWRAKRTVLMADIAKLKPSSAPENMPTPTPAETQLPVTETPVEQPQEAVAPTPEPAPVAEQPVPAPTKPVEAPAVAEAMNTAPAQETPQVDDAQDSDITERDIADIMTAIENADTGFAKYSKKLANTPEGLTKTGKELSDNAQDARDEAEQELDGIISEINSTLGEYGLDIEIELDADYGDVDVYDGSGVVFENLTSFKQIKDSIKSLLDGLVSSKPKSNRSQNEVTDQVDAKAQETPQVEAVKEHVYVSNLVPETEAQIKKRNVQSVFIERAKAKGIIYHEFIRDDFGSTNASFRISEGTDGTYVFEHIHRHTNPVSYKFSSYEDMIKNLKAVLDYEGQHSIIPLDAAPKSMPELRSVIEEHNYSATQSKIDMSDNKRVNEYAFAAPPVTEQARQALKVASATNAQPEELGLPVKPDAPLVNNSMATEEPSVTEPLVAPEGAIDDGDVELFKYHGLDLDKVQHDTFVSPDIEVVPNGADAVNYSWFYSNYADMHTAVEQSHAHYVADVNELRAIGRKKSSRAEELIQNITKYVNDVARIKAMSSEVDKAVHATVLYAVANAESVKEDAVLNGALNNEEADAIVRQLEDLYQGRAIFTTDSSAFGARIMMDGKPIPIEMFGKGSPDIEYGSNSLLRTVIDTTAALLDINQLDTNINTQGVQYLSPAALVRLWADTFGLFVHTSPDGQKAHVLGVAGLMNRSIEISSPKDLQTLIHEIGHHTLTGVELNIIDQFLSGWTGGRFTLPNAPQNVQDPLSFITWATGQQITKDVKANQANGVAELFRMFTINPDALQVSYPEIYDRFNSLISPELRQAATDMRKQLVVLASTSADIRATDNIANTDDIGKADYANVIKHFVGLSSKLAGAGITMNPADIAIWAFVDQWQPAMKALRSGLNGKLKTPQQIQQEMDRFEAYIGQYLGAGGKTEYALTGGGLETESGRKVSLEHILGSLGDGTDAGFFKDKEVFLRYIIAKSHIEDTHNVYDTVEAVFQNITKQWATANGQQYAPFDMIDPANVDAFISELAGLTEIQAARHGYDTLLKYANNPLNIAYTAPAFKAQQQQIQNVIDSLYKKARNTGVGTNNTPQDVSFTLNVKNAEEVDNDPAMARFVGAAKEYNDLSRAVIYFYYKSGLIDLPTYTKMSRERQNYADFHRVDDEIQARNPALPTSLQTAVTRVENALIKISPNKDRGNSDKMFRDPLKSLTEQVERCIKKGALNQINATFSEVFLNDGVHGAEFSSIVGASRGATGKPTSSIATQIQPPKNADPASLAAHRIFSYMRDGKPVYIQINDDLVYKSLTQMSDSSSIRQLNAIVGFYRTMIVTSPTFIIRNAIRDRIGIMRKSKYIGFKDWPKLWATLFEPVFHPARNEITDKANAAGFGGSQFAVRKYMKFLDIQQQVREDIELGKAGFWQKAHIIARNELSFKAPKRGKDLAPAQIPFVTSAWKWLGRMAERSELAPKVLEYELALKSHQASETQRVNEQIALRGLDRTNPKDADKIKLIEMREHAMTDALASQDARNLQDFGRIGAHMATLNGLFGPFLSGKVSGTVSDFRSTRSRPLKALTIQFMMTALNATASNWWNEDEARRAQYNAFTDIIKDTFLLIPGDMISIVSGGRYNVGKWDEVMSIPLGFTDAVMASFGRRLVESVYEANDKNKLGQKTSWDKELAPKIGPWLREMLQQDLPVTQDNIAGPLGSVISLVANYDFYLKKRIVPESEIDLGTWVNYDLVKNYPVRKMYNASRIGMAIAKALPGKTIDPRQVDFFIRDVFGTVGRDFLRLGDIGYSADADMHQFEEQLSAMSIDKGQGKQEVIMPGSALKKETPRSFALKSSGLVMKQSSYYDAEVTKLLIEAKKYKKISAIETRPVMQALDYAANAKTRTEFAKYITIAKTYATLIRDNAKRMPTMPKFPAQ